MRRTLLTLAAFTLCATGVGVGTADAMSNPQTPTAPAVTLPAPSGTILAAALPCDNVLPGPNPECIDLPPVAKQTKSERIARLAAFYGATR